MTDYLLNHQMTFTAAAQRPQQTPSRFNASYFWMCGRMLTLTAAEALFAMSAQAQPAEPATKVATSSTAPKYAASDMGLAFKFMDANKDGKISREEAAGFRGVARHFDEADTNKDNALSREEFENALNSVKPQ
jgi:hypothetical protein